MTSGRKYHITMISVFTIVALVILGGVAKKFFGMDIMEVIKWACAAVASAGIGGSATIAYEDARQPTTGKK